LEALAYDMPFGMVFRKAVLWHDGKPRIFRNLQEDTSDLKCLKWNFRCSTPDGWRLETAFDGGGNCLHRLPYMKTDCSGSFEVANNSLARASLFLTRTGEPAERLETTVGAVLEMTGG
jgi:hypothetical protein